MSNITRKGAEEARSQLPELLDAAANGRSTIITKHGRPVAALVPLNEYDARGRQQSILPLSGSGRGLWGRAGLGNLRDEWSR
jgi:prevent-host-death family protein